MNARPETHIPQVPASHKELLTGMSDAMKKFHEFLEAYAGAFLVPVNKSWSSAAKIEAIRREINGRLNRLAHHSMRAEWEQLFDALQDFDGACAEWAALFSIYTERLRDASS